MFFWNYFNPFVPRQILQNLETVPKENGDGGKLIDIVRKLWDGVS